MKKITYLAWLMVALILLSSCSGLREAVDTNRVADNYPKIENLSDSNTKNGASQTALETVSPESLGISSKNVTNFLTALSNANLATHSVMMLRDGKVFAEGYEENYDMNSLQRMYSVSKSFVGMAIGLLVEEGEISLDDTLEIHFPEYITASTHSWIRGTTIKNLLKMASPHNRGVYVAETPNWIESFFTTTPGKAPGTKFYYDTCGTYLLGVIVEKITGMDFLEYIKDRALNQMGFSEESWCVDSPEGYAWGGSGVMCTTTDLAKFSMLVMNDGVYNGEQLLPLDYVQEAKSFQILDDDSGTPYYGQGYGYQIWMVDSEYGGEGAFAFLGMGDQLAICIPEKDLIFVCTSDNQGSSTSRLAIFNLFKQYIIDTAVDVPLAENGANYTEMLTALDNIKLPIVQGSNISTIASSVIGSTYNSTVPTTPFSSLKIEITGDTGVLKYSTARGDKELLFGLGKNVVGTLDEPQYFGTAIRTPKGTGYQTACSGAWTNNNTFVLKVQVIDDYLANMTMTFNFSDGNMSLTTKYTAEWFLEEYKMSSVAFVKMPEGYETEPGAVGNPFIISNLAQFVQFADDVNSGVNFSGKYIKLTSDIVMNTGDASTWVNTPPAITTFKSIGSETYKFNGNFDGDGHTISGLYLTKSGDGELNSVVGMFGCTDAGAIIKNFALVNSCIVSNNWSGGIIGEVAGAGKTVVQNVYCDAYIYSKQTGGSGTIVGGIVGGTAETSNVTIESCVFAGSIISSSTKNTNIFVGGIFGGTGSNATSSIIKNCLNIGTVKSTVGGKYLGGIVGRSDKGMTIENCINAVAPISSEADGVTDIWAGSPSSGRTTRLINCYYVSDKAYQRGGSVTFSATVQKLTTINLIGSAALEGTDYAPFYYEWTKRDGDYIMPTGVVQFAPLSKLPVTTPIVSSGASVRLATPTGLRFTGIILTSTVNSLKTTYGESNVTFGMIIVPKDYLASGGTNGVFTVAALENAGKTYLEIPALVIANAATAEAKGYYEFNAVIANVLTANYGREFSAITYIRIVDGENISYQYSAYNATDNSRSITAVADSALNDLSIARTGEYQTAIIDGGKTKYSPYTEAQRLILSGFIPA